MKTVIEYPDWHDKARSLRDNGKTQTQVADIMGISLGRISVIATPNWRQFLVLNKIGGRISDVKNIENYEFRSYPSLTPKDAEATNKNKPRGKKYRIDQDMPANREFESSKKLVEGTSGYKYGITYTIRCSKCGNFMSHLSTKGPLPFDFTAKIFRASGWIVGGSPRADLCPDHAYGLKGKPEPKEPVKSFKELLPMTQAMAPVTTVPEVATVKEVPAAVMAQVEEAKQREALLTPRPVVPAPTTSFMPPEELRRQAIPEMSRSDRRIIFSKLEELYVDEKTGYREDWNDSKVAVDLGVPTEWVKEVRDENFGPEISASMRAKTYTDLTNLGERIERHIVLIDKKLEIQTGLDNKVSEIVSAVEAAIERFDELKANLDTSDAQMKTLMEQFSADVGQFRKLFADLKALSST